MSYFEELIQERRKYKSCKVLRKLRGTKKSARSAKFKDGSMLIRSRESGQDYLVAYCPKDIPLGIIRKDKKWQAPLFL